MSKVIYRKTVLIYENFTMRIFKYFILIILLTTVGCTTFPIKMSKSVDRNSKIGIISLMGGSAVQVNNPNPVMNLLSLRSAIMIPMPSFNYDTILADNLYMGFKNNGFQQVNVIKAPDGTDNPFSNLSLIRAGCTDFEAKTKQYLQKILVPNEYDYIIAILPYYLDCSGNTTLEHFRYGVSFGFLVSKPYFFAACRILVMDGKTYQVLAKDNGESVKNCENISWPGKITENTEGMLILKEWLKQSVTKDITYKAFSLMHLSSID